MEWTEDLLKEVTRLGAAAYTPKQTAFALGLSPAQFIICMQDEEHPACIAYYNGFYSSELAIREGVFQLARSGSSPAQTLSLKIFDETRKTLKREGLGEDET
jgi:hypothetical protein